MIYHNASHTRGVVLVLVLLVLATLTTLAMGLAYRTRIELELAGSNAKQIQAYYLALGGLERGMALLDRRGSEGEETPFIPQWIATAGDEALFSSLENVHRFDNARLFYHMRDEQAGLNLIRQRDDVIERVLGRELTSRILDWQDADDTPHGLAGAETIDYQSKRPPYRAKNQPFSHVRELLFLEGVTYQNYLGEDLNQNLQLDKNERDGSISLPEDNGDYHLDPGLIHLVTVYGDGKVNLNAAPREVLAALPGMDEASADHIIEYRYGSDGRPGTEDDIILHSGQDLSDIAGLTGVQRNLLGQHGCFDSDYARLFAYAQWDENTQCCLTATADTSTGRPVLINREKLY